MAGLPEKPEIIKLGRKGPVLYVWLNPPDAPHGLGARTGNCARHSMR